jgi:hypothetical protein
MTPLCYSLDCNCILREGTKAANVREAFIT